MAGFSSPSMTAYSFAILSQWGIYSQQQTLGPGISKSYLDPLIQLTSPRYEVLFTTQTLTTLPMDFIYSFMLGSHPLQDPPLAPHDLLGRGGSGIPENAVTKV